MMLIISVDRRSRVFLKGKIVRRTLSALWAKIDVRKNDRKSLKYMVGDTGIEPVPPAVWITGPAHKYQRLRLLFLVRRDSK